MWSDVHYMWYVYLKYLFEIQNTILWFAFNDGGKKKKNVCDFVFLK